jgi:hypothetical protein
MIQTLANLAFGMGIPQKIDIQNEVANTVASKNLFPLYKWQKDFADLASNQLISVEASTGSGKSLAIKISSHKWTEASPLNKVIICVPQRSIGAEFNTEYFPLDGKEVFWSAPTNLCADKSESSIKALINFIITPAQNMPAALRVIVVCNPTLVMAYKRLNDKSFMDNVKIVFDETHHVSTGEDSSGNFDPNGLGGVFLDLINKNPTVSFLIVTATHFRRDKTTIIPKAYLERFVKFQVPFYVVMEDCRKFTKSIQFQYGICKKNFINGIKECYKPGEKTIIFIHSRLSKNGIDFKHDSVQEVVKALGKIVKVDKSIGCYIVENGDHRTVVADLVTAGMQENASQYIKLCAKTAKETKNPKEYKVGVIVAMNMFKEGCDYPPLAHCIIHGVRENYGDIIQMAGRVVRDYEGKPTAKVTMLLPKDLNGDDLNSKLQNHLKFIISAMSMLDIFMPVLLRVKQKSNAPVAFGGNVQSPLNMLGNFNQQNKFTTDVIVDFTNKTDGDTDAKISWDKRLDIMTDICEKNLVGEQKLSARSIAEYILKQSACAIISHNNVIDMDTITDEFIKQIDTTELLTTFASDIITPKHIKDFNRKVLIAMGSNYVTEQECIKWLKDNGVTNNQQLNKNINRPSNIPSMPHQFYGYTSKKEFWEVVNPKNIIATEEECIKWLKDSGVTSAVDQKFKNRPSNIPSSPHRTYGYSSVKEFWGIVNPKVSWATEKECIKWLKDNGVTSTHHPKFISRPSNIPYNPHITYGYSSVKEFWGIVNPKVSWATEKECIKWLKDNGVTSTHHPKFISRPSNIPYHPERTYGYSSCKEFWELVNGAWATEKECIKWCRDNEVTCGGLMHKFKNRPSNIPSDPHIFYGYSSQKEFWSKVRKGMK